MGSLSGACWTGVMKASQADHDGVSQRHKQQTGTSVLIPPDLLSRPNLVSLATRLKMTPTQQAAFTQGVIAESGGDDTMVDWLLHHMQQLTAQGVRWLVTL